MTKKSVFALLNLLLVTAVFIGNYFYLSEFSIFKKAFCSGGFALLGIVNCVYACWQKATERTFCVAMATGLVFAMLGDIVLNCDFILGAALFALGHLFYLVSYCFLRKFSLRDLIPCAILFAATGCYILFCPLLTFDAPVMWYVCLVYALVISVMTGKAISNFLHERGALFAILMIGSILFCFSDLMLVFDWFMGIGKISGILCMSTYYPAQCLLGFSAFYATAFHKGNRFL